MKKALIIANMLFASASVWGMVPNDSGQRFENKRKFSQVIENNEKEDRLNKKKKVKDNTQNSIHVPQPIYIYDVLQDGSRFVRIPQKQPRTSLQFRRSVLNLAQSSRSLRDDCLKNKMLKQSIVSFYGNESILQYIQTHQLNDVISKFTSGNVRTLEEFSRQKPLLIAFMRQQNFTDISILRLGGVFPSLKKLEMDTDQVKGLPLKSLSFPALKKLKIEISPKCFNKANDLISLVSSTLQNLEIELVDNYSEYESESESGNESVNSYSKSDYVVESIEDNSKESVSLPKAFPIPESIWLCENLESLYLKILDSDFTSLPREIDNLKKLKVLYLEDSEYLKTLPPEIGNLRSLEYLNVDFTKIRSLPSEIWNLTKLETVRLDDEFSARRFTDIKDLFNMEDDTIMWETESLDMSNAGITDLSEFPIDIIEFVNTKKIDLSKNEYFDSIDKIPDLVFMLPKLESVVLSASLSAIPEIESIEDGIQTDRFNVRYKNPQEAGQIRILGKEDEKKYRAEYTSDALMKERNKRKWKINGKINEIRREGNTGILTYLIAYKNRFKTSNNRLIELTKEYQKKDQDIKEKTDSLRNLINRLGLNKESKSWSGAASNRE